MTNHLTEEHQMRMVVRNLQPQNKKYLFAQPIKNFKHLLATGLQIEDGLRKGLLDGGKIGQKRGDSS
ncbi:hypothetical protein ACQ1ZA_16230, partial [Enterococcus faecalis]|uniref:hypothetical protein n=1 Tax=Enterococcus faecalis TaxID=1351 RepID=UPI003D6A5D06